MTLYLNKEDLQKRLEMARRRETGLYHMWMVTKSKIAEMEDRLRVLDASAHGKTSMNEAFPSVMAPKGFKRSLIK